MTAGGTGGAEAWAREKSWSWDWLGILIGIAGAGPLDAGFVSFDGAEENPADGATEEANMKSSKFMASGCGVCDCWSTLFRNWAIPLGALRGGALEPAGTVGGGFMSFVWRNLGEVRVC